MHFASVETHSQCFKTHSKCSSTHLQCVENALQRKNASTLFSLSLLFPNRVTYVHEQEDNESQRNVFSDAEEATTFWRTLWEAQGAGNIKAEWLDEVRDAIREKVTVPPEKDFELSAKQAEKVIMKKRNWSTPGPDRIVNFWWKRANCLHVGIVRAFQVIAQSDQDVPLWFTEGRTSLIPKPGEFSSENQRPITCLNTVYKWFTSCLLEPVNSHLEDYDLMEGEHRGAKEKCSGTTDNLLIDRMVCQDSQRGRRNISMAWIDIHKAYDSVSHNWLKGDVLYASLPTVDRKPDREA